MWFEKLNNKEVEELEKGLSSINEDIQIKFVKDEVIDIYRISVNFADGSKGVGTFNDCELYISKKDVNIGSGFLLFHSDCIDFENSKQLNIAYCSFMASKFGKDYLKIAKEDFYERCANNAINFSRRADEYGANSEKAKLVLSSLQNRNVTPQKKQKSLVLMKN